MDLESLAKGLETLLTEEIRKQSPKKSKFELSAVGQEQGAIGDPKLRGREIAESLVKQAIASGLGLKCSNLEAESFKGGNTAEYVGLLTLSAPFVFKMDSVSKKLANEGLAIRQIKNNESLSPRFRDSWPIVYAVHTESPYAYLMEIFPKSDGWVSLEERLYRPGTGVNVTSAHASRLVDAVLDILFDGYEDSINRRQNPSIHEDYVKRIRERLEEIEKKDTRFASKPIEINGTRFKEWREYLKILDDNSAYLADISSPFTTVVHGDSNPGNIMLKVGGSRVEVKLIDPKEWVTGDYLFDICKIAHFIEGTGPAENPTDGNMVVANFATHKDGNSLSYSISPAEWTRPFVETCLERTGAFAANHGDKKWESRYKLGMAANLLGLPLGRMNKGRPDSALILYGEGLRWLSEFCAGIKMV